ncbi:MAG: NAD(P)H-dependent oxidoreductase [Cytophagaceae bacterium]|nr:NAD(P)H-dependent oxidoreductase [Cytophagaceae bacterium]
MITIISGTNRPNSNSIRVANYYQALLKERGMESQILDLAKIPEKFIFTALYDNLGKDPEFNKFVDMIKGADKYVFIVPEYNGSFPGVLKAFIDGLDYTASFKDKKCTLVGIATGQMAGTLALSHLTDILNYLGMHVHALKPRLPCVQNLLTAGKINDPVLEKLLQSQAESFIKF